MAFHEDPSVLTKDKLKNELTANNVPLPSGEHKKEVYVQLYLKNLTVLNNKTSPPPDTFSSDDEFTPPVVSNRSRSGRKADRKTDRPRTEETDVTDLTDEDLREQLVKHGVDTGPIVASTRKVYEKKLQKLLDEPAAESPGVPEATPEITALSKADSNQNGNTHSDQYSDKEDEEIAAPEPEPVPVVEKSLRSRGKTPLTVRTSSRKQTKVVVEENLSSGDHTSSKGSESVVEDILANEISTPTSFGITCRRPIRGAAGRPLKPSEYWLDESLVRRTVHTENRSYSESISSVGSPRSSSKAPAHRSILSMLLRLLLLAALAASLYYAYKNLDHQQVSGNLKGLLDSVVTPLQGVVDSATTYLGINGNKAVEGSGK